MDPFADALVVELAVANAHDVVVYIPDAVVAIIWRCCCCHCSYFGCCLCCYCCSAVVGTVDGFTVAFVVALADTIAVDIVVYVPTTVVAIILPSMLF